MLNEKNNLAIHLIISRAVGTMRGCGRLHPFSIIIYHSGLFFSPFPLAASSKRMGTLEGEASSELNIDESRCVISVLICDATQGQPGCWGCSFTVVRPHKNVFKNKIKGTGSGVCSYNRVWGLPSSPLSYSRSRPLCCRASFCGHLWPVVISDRQSRLVWNTEMAGQKVSELVLDESKPLNFHYCRVQNIREIVY